MGFVFISYARKESKFAEKLDAFLEKNGIKTWRDTRNLDPYRDFTGEIESAIREASHFVVCLTKDVKIRKDSFVRREIAYAVARQKPIIPIVFPDGELPVQISTISSFFIDNTTNTNAVFKEVVKRITKSVVEIPFEPVHLYPPEVENYLNELHNFISKRLQQSVIDLLQISVESSQKEFGNFKSEPEKFTFDTSPILIQYKIDKGTLESKANTLRQFDNFNDAFQFYNGRLLLLGEPGAGKTTTLLAFAREAVVRKLNDPKAPVPILASIRKWDYFTDVEKWVSENVPMSALLNNQKLYILDALDELPEAQNRFISQVNERIPPQDGVIISSRVAEYRTYLESSNNPFKIAGAIRLLPLNDTQIHEFARKNNQELYISLKADKELKEICRTPLLLSLLSIVFNKEHLGEHNKISEVLVFDQYIRFRFIHELNRNKSILFDEDTVRKYLSELAIGESFGYFIIDSSFTNQKAFAIIGKEAAKFIEFGLRMNFFYEDKEGKFEFIHRKLAEYCATKLFVDTIIENGEIGWGDYKTFDTVIEILAASPSLSMPLLIEALSSKKSKQRFNAISAMYYISEINKGLLTSIVPRLLEMINDPSFSIQEMAIKTLSKLGYSSAELQPRSKAIPNYAINPQRVRIILNSENPTSRKQIIEQIEGSRSQEYLDILLDAINDPDKSVRQAVCNALGGFKSTKALDCLIFALYDNSHLVRYAALQAIGETLPYKAIPLVGELLEDEDPSIQSLAENVLRKINTAESIKTLDKLQTKKRNNQRAIL